MKKKRHMKIVKFATYVKKKFCTDEDNKKEFKKCKKSEIIVITQENIKVLHIVFVIYAT